KGKSSDHVLMLIRILPMLILFSSCALFQGEPSLLDTDKVSLLTSIKFVGEGRRRLPLGQSHYLCGVDSCRNENSDWVLAVQIPLHGEEAMILPNLKQKIQPNQEVESFEERISDEFKKRKLDKSVTPKIFVREMRSLIRFVLAPE